MNSYSVMDPGEVWTLGLDFTAQLNAGEALQSPVSCTPSVLKTYEGATDPTPANIKGGQAAAINGNVVFQHIQNPVANVDYELKFSVTTSAGRVLVESRRLPARLK